MTGDAKKLWDSILTDIELLVTKATFTTWFKGTYILKITDGTVYLGVSSNFVKDWLSNKYHKNILRALREKDENIRALEYVITMEPEKHKEKPAEVPLKNPTSELPLQDFYINKDDCLNPRYTFESFIVGSFNELAHAAAQTLVKKPGAIYNPFFIYGGTGHGKTHLIQAIGNYFKKHYPQKKVYYLTSEKFAQDYINSLQTNKISFFKEKYRKYDLLIIDDIQFFSNKEKSQEELFHLFNHFHENGKQIVFSSDKHPNFIPNLEDRLKSRFGSGMIVDIPYPDVESRAAILLSKAAQNNFALSREAADYIATAVEGNIRELEGILNALIMQTQLKNKELSIVDIKNLIKNNTKPKKIVAVKDIVKVIADFYNVEESSIYDRSRRKEVVKPRQVAMYLLREDCNISYPSIGQKLGGKDHTTVIHSCEKIKNEIKTDPTLVQELNQIRSLL